MTQLRAFGAFTGAAYGAFNGKGGLHPVQRLTQLRAFGAFTGRRYGSFADRPASQPPIPDVVFHGPGGVRIPFRRVKRNEDEEIMALIFAFLQTQQ